MLREKNVILYVDHRPHARATRELLEREGHCVALFDDGYKATEAIEGQLLYDIAFVNMGIPASNRIQPHTADWVIEMSARYQPHAPIIALSSIQMTFPRTHYSLRHQNPESMKAFLLLVQLGEIALPKSAPTDLIWLDRVYDREKQVLKDILKT